MQRLPLLPHVLLGYLRDALKLHPPVSLPRNGNASASWRRGTKVGRVDGVDAWEEGHGVGGGREQDGQVGDREEGGVVRSEKVCESSRQVRYATMSNKVERTL